MWGISAVLLMIGYLNAVVVSALRRSKISGPAPGPVDLLPLEVGSGVPGTGFSRIASLLDEVERTREEEKKSGVGHRRPRGSGAAD